MLQFQSRMLISFESWTLVSGDLSDQVTREIVFQQDTVFRHWKQRPPSHCAYHFSDWWLLAPAANHDFSPLFRFPLAIR